MDGDLDLRAVRFSEDFVRGAWADVRRWPELEGRLKDSVSRRLRVLVSLPAPPGGDDAAIQDWQDRVSGTVERLRGFGALYEVTAGSTVEGGVDAFLDVYESVVWTIYRVDPDARLGGPGADWSSPVVEALARRCSERRLPLHFLSWRVSASRPSEAAESIARAATLQSRYPLEQPAELILSEWSPADDDDLEVELSSLMGLQDRRLSMACARSPLSGAIRAFHQAGAVQLAPSVEGESVKVVATMADDEFRGIVWTGLPQATVSLLLSGLAPGRNAVVERRVVGAGTPASVETVTHAEPLEIKLEIGKGSPVDLRVRIR